MEFVEFPKMARLSREVIITEKIDGTNAQIAISEDGQIFAGNRTRWITPKNDNHGFAAWVESNRDELLALGPGRHFGEWYGAGIQRNYGLDEKRFALFNVERWKDSRPDCCGVVPVLLRAMFTEVDIDAVMENLRRDGSAIAPGFMNPEGIVIYHVAAGISFKKTLGKDGVPKSLAARL